MNSTAIRHRPAPAAAPVATLTAAAIKRGLIKLCDDSLGQRQHAPSVPLSAWSAWSKLGQLDHGHQVMPAAPEAIAAYLTDRADQGAAAVHASTAARAAIGATHRDARRR